MKKILSVVLLLVALRGGSLFAWDPSFLKTYPDTIAEDPWQIDFGFGAGNFPYRGTHAGYLWIPPLILRVDRNVPLGGLPFFFGGGFGFSGHGNFPGHGHREWYYSTLSLAVRFGYHFNWGIDKLDTYAVGILGADLNIGDTDKADIMIFEPWTLFGVKAGARYYPLNWFGFYVETGFHWFSFFDVGVSFKF